MRRLAFVVSAFLLCALCGARAPAGAEAPRLITSSGAPATVTFPDSSQVTLGHNTMVEVGPYRREAGEAGSTIGLAAPGAVRITVRHSKGASASYALWTPMMWIAVRGTVSVLLWDGPTGSTLTCLKCWANDVVATVHGREYAVLTGETMHVARNGKVAIDPTTDGVLQSFLASGLSI